MTPISNIRIKQNNNLVACLITISISWLVALYSKINPNTDIIIIEKNNNESVTPIFLLDIIIAFLSYLDKSQLVTAHGPPGHQIVGWKFFQPVSST